MKKQVIYVVSALNINGGLLGDLKKHYDVHVVPGGVQNISDSASGSVVVLDISSDQELTDRKFSGEVHALKNRRNEFMLLTDRPDSAGADAARSMGIDFVLGKPIESGLVLQAVESLLLKQSIQSRGKQPDSKVDMLQQGAACLLRVANEIGNGKRLPNALLVDCAAKISDDVGRDGLLDWLSVVNEHHSYTFRHCMHVSGLASALAEKLKFSARDKNRFVQGAMLHDIGKLKIPLDILDKPGRLTDEERSVIERHPTYGRDIMENEKDWDRLIVDMIYQHHELLDGSGYPQGLKGDEISDPVRLLTIIDIFSALVDKRSYKDALEPEKAFDILYSMGSKVDQGFVRFFQPIGMEVLSNLKRAA